MIEFLMIFDSWANAKLSHVKRPKGVTVKCLLPPASPLNIYQIFGQLQHAKFSLGSWIWYYWYLLWFHIASEYFEWLNLQSCEFSEIRFDFYQI